VSGAVVNRHNRSARWFRCRDVPLRGDEAGQAVPPPATGGGPLLAAQVPQGQGQFVAEAAKGIAVRRGGEPVENSGPPPGGAWRRPGAEAVRAIGRAARGRSSLPTAASTSSLYRSRPGASWGARRAAHRLHHGVQAGAAGGHGGTTGSPGSRQPVHSTRMPRARLVHDVQGHDQMAPRGRGLQAEVQVPGQLVASRTRINGVREPSRGPDGRPMILPGRERHTHPGRV